MIYLIRGIPWRVASAKGKVVSMPLFGHCGEGHPPRVPPACVRLDRHRGRVHGHLGNLWENGGRRGSVAGRGLDFRRETCVCGVGELGARE